VSWIIVILFLIYSVNGDCEKFVTPKQFSISHTCYSQWSWIFSVYKCQCEKLKAASCCKTCYARKYISLLRSGSSFLFLNSISDLSRTFKTPLVSAPTASPVGVIAERRSPRRWGAPARTRVARALTLTGTFDLTEADSTASDAANWRQRIDPRLDGLEYWTRDLTVFTRDDTELSWDCTLCTCELNVSTRDDVAFVWDWAVLTCELTVSTRDDVAFIWDWDVSTCELTVSIRDDVKLICNWTSWTCETRASMCVEWALICNSRPSFVLT